MNNYMQNLLLATTLLISFSSFAEPVAIIVNASNSEEISLSDIKAIYSDIRYTWSNGNKIKLFELPVKSASRETFAKNVLNKSAVDSERDWSNRKITNTIKNKPKIKRDKLVVKFVAKIPQAIGYVPISTAEGNDNIRVILTID